MKKEQIREISFCLCGRADPENYNIVKNVINPIDTDPAFMPEVMGWDERKLDPYYPEVVRGELLPKIERWGSMISRKKTIKYFGDIIAQHEPSLWFNIHRSISKNNIEKVFEWSDSVADTYLPDAATLTVVPNLPDNRTDNDSIELLQAFHGSFLNPGSYPKYGPKLGMFTWLSQLHVEAIGLKNLESTPLLIVEENKNGVVKLILGENHRPWEMELQTWIDTWHTAMDHLRKFQVFANPTVVESKIKVYRAKNCSTPRLDGRVRDISTYLAPEDREG